MIKLFGAAPSGVGAIGVAGIGEEGLAPDAGWVGVEGTLTELFWGGDDLDRVSTSCRPFRDTLASHATSSPTATSTARRPTTTSVRRLRSDPITAAHFYAKRKWKSKTHAVSTTRVSGWDKEARPKL